MSEKIENALKQLNALLINLKKSINNKIKATTLQKKRQVAKDLSNQIEFFLLESSLTDSQLNHFLKISKNLVNEIELIIQQKLSEHKIKLRLRTVVKIFIWLKIKSVTMALDIKTASELASLIPNYDGNPGGMKSFTDAICLVETIVPDAQQAAAIQLILTKLTGKARDLFTAVPADFQEIKNKITADCIDKSTSDLALANLKNVKPRKGQETSGFTKEIDILADKLKHAYIREEVPNAVATKLANKAAIQTLIASSHKQETKMLLKVGKFASLSEALNIVIENENFNNEPSASIMQMRKNFSKNRPNYQSNYQNRYNGNNSRGNFRNSPRPNPHQPRSNYGQQSSNRSRYNHPNNNQQQYRQQNWVQDGNRRMYHMNVVHGSGSLPPNQFAPNGALSQPVAIVPSNLMPPQRQQQQQQQQHASSNFLGTPFLQHPYSQ